MGNLRKETSSPSLVPCPVRVSGKLVFPIRSDFSQLMKRGFSPASHFLEVILDSFGKEVPRTQRSAISGDLFSTRVEKLIFFFLNEISPNVHLLIGCCLSCPQGLGLWPRPPASIIYNFTNQKVWKIFYPWQWPVLQLELVTWASYLLKETTRFAL